MTAPAETETTAPASAVRPIVVDILAAHEDWAYLLHPELPVRPATSAEMEAMEAAAYAEFQAAMASKAAVGTIPHGPWPHTKAAARAAVTAPEPAAVTVTDQPAAEPAEDPAPELDPIAELALSRFEEAHAAEDERTATAQIPVADEITTTTQAIKGDQ